MKLLKKFIHKYNITIIRFFIIISLFIVWELFSKWGIINSFLFSKPSDILKIFIKYLKDLTIFSHIGISLLETLIGLILGMVNGVIFASLLWWFPKIEKICEPFLVVLNALPKTALAPLIIIWVGTGIKGIVCVAMSISLIVTIIQSLQYFKCVDYEYIKLFKSFKASKLQIFTKLILPINRYNFISLLKINIGMSWIGVVVGEFIVSKQGIGYLIMYGSQVFRMSIVMMGVLLLAIISYIMYFIVNYFEKKGVN